MDNTKLNGLLEELLKKGESETIEFKNPPDGKYDTGKIGEYFSALSNEANLRGLTCAWLVFGIDDKTKEVTGTTFRQIESKLDGLFNDIVQRTQPRMTFRNIHEFYKNGKRVLFFEIPAAPAGMPVAWNSRCYGRAGSSLIPLTRDKKDEIRNQTLDTDWSAQIVESATYDDLDSDAVQKAKEKLVENSLGKYSLDEVNRWKESALFDRMFISNRGKLTRTAILLLGKPESAHLLSPHPVQMTWKLEGLENDYEHFGPPFLLNSTKVFQKIRNVRLRVIPNTELLNKEINKYDVGVVLEAIHNAIAHQNYSLNSRIIVAEQERQLVITNAGEFYQGQPEDYYSGNNTPTRYRNAMLTKAMVKLGMIDQMGYGIHRMFKDQAARYLPLPDFDVSKPDCVRVVIHGRIVDLAYTRLLAQRTDLSTSELLTLDRLQKKLSVDHELLESLRKKKLVEGRKPNYYIASVAAVDSKRKAQYILNKAFDDKHYISLIEEFLRTYGSATRQDINALLLGKLSDALDTDQKDLKIANLLTKARRQGRIKNEGTRKLPRWVLIDIEN